MKFQFFIGLMILVLATCSTRQPARLQGGLAGQVMISTTCPTQQNGQACLDQPYQALLTVNNAQGGRVTQFQTDSQGRFRVTLAPGTYILHPESSGAIPFANDQTFTVATGQFTYITIYYTGSNR